MAYSFARRTELAREQGFTSYSEKRRAVHAANESDYFQDNFGTAGGRSGEYLPQAKAYLGFIDRKAQNDYKVGGPKYRWLVDTTHQITPDEWRALYPKGRRE
jgi:hypothetical protein